MLRVTKVDKATVKVHGVVANYAIQADIDSYDVLECISRHIRHNLSIDFSIELVDAEHVRFATRTSSANAFGTPSTEVGLVDFNMACERKLVLAVFGDSSGDGSMITTDSHSIRP
jgi:hypothetical protein